MSDQVPKGWRLTNIKKITQKASFFADGDWVESKDQDPNGSNRLIQLADIGDGIFLNKSSRFMNDEQFQRLGCNMLKTNDILVARMPDPLGRACLYPLKNSRAATVVDVAIIRTQNADHYYLMSAINSTEFRRKIEINASGTTRTRISRGNLADINLILPPLPEQKKIAAILTSVDDVIEKTEAQISKLQDLKKGMMTELLTKGIGHTEFKDSPVGRIPKSWDVKRIADLFHERRKLTNDTEAYPLCSLTIENGLIRKTERYERSFLLTDQEAENYKIVFPNDIILNPMNLRWGAISKSNESIPVSVSKYYNIICAKSKSTSSAYYKSLFQSESYIKIYDAISTGTLIEKRRVHLSQFINIIVPNPSSGEQHKIANIIGSMDKQIENKNQILSRTKAIKKALMNDLLTGKKRVNI